jgi:tetratricopeptide (TPR) repeat protein
MNLNITKKAVVFIVIFILVIAVLSGFILYFKERSQNLNSRYGSLKANFDKASKDFNDLQDKNTKLTADYQGLAFERDNLIVQIKGLIVDRNRARELEGIVDKNKLDMDVLMKEKQAASDKTIEQDQIIKNLKAEHDKLFKEKEALIKELARQKDVSLLNRSEREKADLKKDYDKAIRDLKLSNVKARTLEGSIAQLQRDLEKTKINAQDVSSKLEDMKKRYSDAVDKNTKFEQKIIEEPKKFAELARQNKNLIRQTSNMHYNLGVFYSKQNEFSRAASEFERALELNPEDAYSHFNLGYIYAEHLVDRNKAIEEFRQYLRLAKKSDKDVDWAKNYLLTWETFEGTKPAH